MCSSDLIAHVLGGTLLGEVDHATQGGEVDDKAAVHAAEPGAVVRATAHGDIESSLTGDIDRGDHVGCVDALSDQTRLLVDHRVVELPSGLVIGIARSDQPAAETGAQCLCELDIGRDNSSQFLQLMSRRAPGIASAGATPDQGQ